MLPQLETDEIENEIMADRDNYTNNDDDEISTNSNDNNDDEGPINNVTAQ